MRIIPADAGSTCFLYCPDRPGWDHPRGCGEHLTQAEFAARAGGSSPRMRGAQARAKPRSRPPRIIPADAGSTHSSSTSFPVIKDHPRGCGEHILPMCLPMILAGSSPRMRGAPVAVLPAEIRFRIIPADAGSTLTQQADHKT